MLTQIFLFWAGQTGQTFLVGIVGSQKLSQMAAHVCGNQNLRLSLNINNTVSPNYPISRFNRTNHVLVFTYLSK